MQPKSTAALFLLAALVALASTAVSGHNITKILAQHPDFSTFNHYLTLTHLADEINRRQTITVCALNNAAMSDIVSKGYSLYTVRNILSFHVLVDYYGTKKLHQITDGTTLTASLFQSTGAAPGNSGYVNITDVGGGKVGFSPSENGGADFNSFYVKSIVEKPYNISVIQISQALSSAEAAAPTPEPSSLNLTSVLAAKGCKAFSALMTATKADKTFQANIDGGLTVFCFGDAVLKDFMPKYKNLTDTGKTALILYHGLPFYNSMGMLKTNNGDVHTLATNGATKYDLTVQNDGDVVTIKTKIVTARITGTLLDEEPLAIYKINKVLLPRELFKKMAAEPASAPAPEAESPKADLAAEPDSSDDSEDDSGSTKKNGSGRINGGGWATLLGGVMCGVAVAFM
ncbi:hypothetical protein V2J09_020749 [Rumex salicifolius]